MLVAWELMDLICYFVQACLQEQMPIWVGTLTSANWQGNIGGSCDSVKVPLSSVPTLPMTKIHRHADLYFHRVKISNNQHNHITSVHL